MSASALESGDVAPRAVPRVAVIGAGIGGLTLANELARSAEVTVFEKARGCGGRMSTRRAGAWQFDFGTQFLTARTPAFRDFLSPHLASGRVREWTGKLVYLEAGARNRKRLWFEPHYVACPGMSSLCRELVQGLDVRLETEVAPLGAHRPGGWELHSREGQSLGSFDWVFSSAPAPQTVRLFDAHLPANAAVRETRLHACFALMVGLDAPWPHTWIAGKSRDNPVEWIAVDSSRPGRDASRTSLVAHASSAWSDANADDELEAVQSRLLAEVAALTGVDPASAKYVGLQRWRYALVEAPEEALPPLLDSTLRLGACGDWCTASRIEDVWHAAIRLATQWRAAMA